MLSLLEERMRDWVKKNLPIKTLEMLPANALQFLQHHGCPCPDIIHEKNLVKLVQLDRFAGKAPGKTLKTTGEVKLFKLVSVEIEGKSLRLIGTAALSKEELKERVAALKELPNASKLAEELGVMSGDVWLPRGEAIKKILVERFFEGFNLITTPALNAKELLLYHSQLGSGNYELLKTNLAGPFSIRGRELFDPMVGTIDRLFLPFSQESIISFLQIITKFLKIFAFDYEGVIVGKPAKLLQGALSEVKLLSKRGEEPGIEFWIPDALGRAWMGPRISWNDKVLTLSLFHSMERCLALLLEKTQGRLPFWLQPEHVRLITLQQDIGEELKQALKGFRVGIDNEERPLASRVGRALRERVPFSIVLGSREKHGSELKVREEGSSAEMTMSIETLLSRLRQLESQ